MKYLLFISCILVTKGADFNNIHLVLLDLSEIGMWISYCGASENILLYLVLYLHTSRIDSSTIIVGPYYY